MDKMAKTLCRPNLVANGMAVLLMLGVQSAQSQGFVPPDSGDLLQQEKPPLASPSLNSKKLFELRRPEIGEEGASFFVAMVDLVGNEAVSRDELTSIVSQYENKDVTFNDLQVLCYEITSYYREKGFLFSRAVVPQQEIQDGKLTLQMIEANLAEVIFDNKSQVKNDFVNKFLTKVKAQQSIKDKPLTRSLLLLQDIPGVKVDSSIQAGKSLGQSDLQLALTPQALKHRIGINNFGSSLTHRERVNATLNFANLAGHGDVLRVSLNTSGERMVQGSLNYDFSLTGDGSHIGITSSYMEYSLGENLKDLNAEGESKTAGVYFRTNWLRETEKNVYSNIRYQYQVLDDQLNQGAFINKRSIDSVDLSLSFDMRNRLSELSATSLEVTLTGGNVNIENSGAAARDALAGETEGGFSRINLQMQSVLRLGEQFDLSFRLSAQKAFQNLDSSQSFIAAGPYAVRAFDGGTLSGDSGVLANTELSYNLESIDYGQFTVYGFVDAAAVEINQSPWQDLSNDNSVNLSGAGLGLRWSDGSSWAFNSYIATPIGSVHKELNKPKTEVLWFELSKQF